jgi:hypothetical protein
MPRLYLDVPQFNAITQKTLQELRERLPDHLWLDNGDVDGTYRAWVSYEPPFDETTARTGVGEILGSLKQDGVDLAGIAVAE